jgi:hypothetical protein
VATASLRMKEWTLRGAAVVCAICLFVIAWNWLGRTTKPVPGDGFKSHTVTAPTYPMALFGGDDSPDKSPGPRAQARTVRGTVLDPEGRPVAGAVVCLSATDAVEMDPGDGRWTRTSNSGQFALSMESAGSGLDLSVRHPRFLPWSHALEGLRESDPGGCTIRLEAGGVVSGTVRATDGKPLEGVTVLLRGRYCTDAMVRGTMLPTGVVELAVGHSGPGGEFELSGLPAHEMVLEAIGPGLRMIQPCAFIDRAWVRAGQRIEIVMESVGIIHLRAVDATSLTPIADVQCAPDWDAIKESVFRPWTSLRKELRLFAWGPTGSELSMHGIPREVLPKGSDSDGRFLLAGLSLEWPIPDGHKVAVFVKAPRYLPVRVEVPLQPQIPYRTPEALEVRMQRDPDYPGVGRVEISRIADPDAERRPWMNLSLWRLDAGSSTSDAGEEPLILGKVRLYGLSDEDNTEFMRQLKSVQERARRDGIRSVHFNKVAIEEDGRMVLNDVPPGEYEFMEFSGLEGGRFQVVADRTTRVTARAAKATIKWPPVGDTLLSLTVRSSSGRDLNGYGVSYARVEQANGKPVEKPVVRRLHAGSTLAVNPVSLGPLDPGVYEVRVEHPGFEAAISRIEVDGAAVVRDVAITLQPEK